MKYFVAILIVAAAGRILRRSRWAQTELMNIVMVALCLGLAVAALVTMPGEVP